MHTRIKKGDINFIIAYVFTLLNNIKLKKKLRMGTKIFVARLCGLVLKLTLNACKSLTGAFFFVVISLLQPIKIIVKSISINLQYVI